MRVDLVQHDGQQVVAIIVVTEIAPLHFRTQLGGSRQDGAVNGLGRLALVGPQAVKNALTSAGD